MKEPPRPLPLPDVLEIVERRRRRRARARAVAGPAVGVVAAGIGGVIVVVLQAGAGDPQQAAPPLSTLPAPSSATPPPSTRLTQSSTPRSSSSTPQPSTPRTPAPPLDGFLAPSYLVDMANSLSGVSPTAEFDRLIEDMTDLANAWEIEHYPAAKAVVMKARLAEISIDPRDPGGDEELIGRFEQAGFTEADAAALADAWVTDVRTAKVMGALIVGAG